MDNCNSFLEGSSGAGVAVAVSAGQCNRAGSERAESSDSACISAHDADCSNDDPGNSPSKMARPAADLHEPGEVPPGERELFQGSSRSSVLSARYKKLAIALAALIILKYKYAGLVVIFVGAGVVIGIIYSESSRDIASSIRHSNHKKSHIDCDSKISRKYAFQDRTSPKSKVAMSEELMKTSAKLSEVLTNRFITRLWYDKINYSENKEFPNSIKYTVDKAVLSLCEKLLDMKMTPLLSVISEKVISHLREFCAYRTSGGDLDRYLLETPTSEFSKCRTKKDIIEQLRKLSLLMAVGLLPPNEKSSHIVFSFSQEIIASHVIYPLVKLISKPDFLNKILLIYLKKQYNHRIQHRKLSSKKLPSDKHSAADGARDTALVVDTNTERLPPPSSETGPAASRKELDNSALSEANSPCSTNPSAAAAAAAVGANSSGLGTEGICEGQSVIALRNLILLLPGAVGTSVCKIYIEIRSESFAHRVSPKKLAEVIEWPEEIRVPCAAKAGCTEDRDCSGIEFLLIGLDNNDTKTFLGSGRRAISTFVNNGASNKSGVSFLLAPQAPGEFRDKSLILTLEADSLQEPELDVDSEVEAIVGKFPLPRGGIDPAGDNAILPAEKEIADIDTEIDVGIPDNRKEFTSESKEDLAPLSEVRDVFSRPEDVLRLTKHLKGNHCISFVMFCYYLCSKRKLMVKGRGHSDAQVLLSEIRTSFRAAQDDLKAYLHNGDFSELERYLNLTLETQNYSFLDSMIDLCCENLRGIIGNLKGYLSGSEIDSLSQKSPNSVSSDTTSSSLGKAERDPPLGSSSVSEDPTAGSAKTANLNQSHRRIYPTIGQPGGEGEISACIKNIISVFRKSGLSFSKDEDLCKTLRELTQDVLKKIDAVLSECNNHIKIRVLVEAKVDLQCYYQALLNVSNTAEIIESVYSIGRFLLSSPSFTVRHIYRSEVVGRKLELVSPQSPDSVHANHYFSIDIIIGSRPCASIIKSYDNLSDFYIHLKDIFPELTREYLDKFPPKNLLDSKASINTTMDLIKDWLTMNLNDPLISRADSLLQFLCISSDTLQVARDFLFQKYNLDKISQSSLLSAQSKLSRKIKLAGSSIMKSSSYFGYKSLSSGLHRGGSFPENSSNQDPSSDSSNRTASGESDGKRIHSKKKLRKSKDSADTNMLSIAGDRDGRCDTGTKVIDTDVRIAQAADVSHGTLSSNGAADKSEPPTDSAGTNSRHPRRASNPPLNRDSAIEIETEAPPSADPLKRSDAEGEAIIVECLFAITEELFILSNPDKWIRQMGIAVFKTIFMRVYGETVGSIVGKRYKTLVSSEVLAALLEKVVNVVDMENIYSRKREKHSEDSPEVIVSKLSPDNVRLEIIEILSTVRFSSSLECAAKYLGKSSVSRALKLLFYMVQNEDINRSLVISVLDHTIRSSLGMA